MKEQNEYQADRDLDCEINLEIYKKFGLELTMAEAVHLRKIFKECREQQKQTSNEGWALNGFELGNEANTRFFYEMFGLQYNQFVRPKQTKAEFEKGMQKLVEQVKLIRSESELI